MDTLPWILLLMPLVAATVIKLALPRAGNLAALAGTFATGLVFAGSVFLQFHRDLLPAPFPWLRAGGFTAEIGIKIDDLSAAMLLVVATIALLVHVFSLGYMKDDSGKSRYFAGLSLFLFSMNGIVLADNFLMMFVFWELVGVSSYILIGHWFTKDAAAEAAKKAFLTNRIGDFGFMAGILLLWGAAGTLEFDGLAAHAANGTLGLTGGMLTAAVLCLFCGAVGKSAQVPLHVWLPDAMEGPTPVSALIHAATMVAAGVYMLARVAFLIALDGQAAAVIAWTGGATALFAALLAVQQDDIKRVLAYSTLSQLGYMVMAVGLQAADAAFFHLFTHAFFKALLFLGAGAVIHACHHEQDIWKMGGLARRMPITFYTFLAGTAALAAVPYVTAGFWSKEMVLAAAWEGNQALFVLAGLVALLTPFYMARLLVVAFLGEARGHGAREAREVPGVMGAPLLVLAVLSLVAGFGFFAKPILGIWYPQAHAPLPVLLVSIGTLVAGAGCGWALYRGRAADPLRIKALRAKLWVDEIYQLGVRIFQDAVAAVLAAIDRYLIDGVLVGGAAALANGLGGVFRRLQSGSLQFYSFVFGFGLLLLWWAAAAL
jgi:NADH-quinone oxidoreductase subunit L